MRDDGKERERVFARRTGREADGDEARNRHQRAGEHREGVGAERKCRGLHLVVAFGQPAEHGVDGGHGVVDHQRQRDDERAQRDALHVDAGHLHDQENHDERHRDGKCDDQAGANAEADEAHDDDDRDRLQ